MFRYYGIPRRLPNRDVLRAIRVFKRIIGGLKGGGKRKRRRARRGRSRRFNPMAYGSGGPLGNPRQGYYDGRGYFRPYWT